MTQVMRAPRFLVLVNPRAGGGRGMQAAWRLESLLREQSIPATFALTTGPGEAVRIAREAAPRFEAVAAVGGDGTVHEVACGLADAAQAAGDPAQVAALAVVPLGTGNDFVKTLGIGTTVDAGFASLANGHRRRIDLGRAGPVTPHGGVQRAQEWFVNDFSAGYAAAVVADMLDPPFYMRPLTGHMAYFVAGFRRTLFRARPMTVRADGEERRRLFYEVHVGNGRYCGGGIQYTPRAELGDGLLDVTMFHTMTRWRHFLAVVGPVSRGNLAPAPDRGIELVRARRVEIEQGSGFAVYLDGESRHVEASASGGASVVVEVVPGALDVLVPDGVAG